MADPTNPQDKQPPVTEPVPEDKHMTVEEYNKAQTAWRSRLEKSVAKTVEDTVARLFAEKAAPAADPDADKQKQEKDSAIAALEKRLAAAEAARKEESAAREQERQARIRSSEREALTRELRAVGITDEDMVEFAHAYLYDRQRSVVTDDQGNVRFKTVDKFGVEELLTLGEGVKRWSASAQGKKFMPPIGVEGSGSKPRQGSAPGQSDKPNRAELLSAISRLSGVKGG